MRQFAYKGHPNSHTLYVRPPYSIVRAHYVLSLFLGGTRRVAVLGPGPEWVIRRVATEVRIRLCLWSQPLSRCLSAPPSPRLVAHWGTLNAWQSKPLCCIIPGEISDIIFKNSSNHTAMFVGQFSKRCPLCRYHNMCKCDLNSAGVGL